MKHNNTVNYLDKPRHLAEGLVYGDVKPGWFGVLYKSRTKRNPEPTLKFYFYSCRDGYQKVSKTRILKGGIYYSHEYGDSDRHALFLQRIESVLKLPKRSKFAKTNHDNVLWIRLSPWWLENKTRRSFLTLMLRLASEYDFTQPWKKENIITVAKRHWRGESTLPAIRRFIRGNTVYPMENPSAHYRGWVEIFEDKTQYQVRRMLVKPV